MSEKAIVSIEQLLEKKIGANPKKFGKDVLLSHIKERMSICNVSSLAGYVELLSRCEEEFQQFVELLVVPETWFFREAPAIKFLSYYIKNYWLSKWNRPLRVLSIPCSTGEEPYSIAISLLEAGLSPDQFSIDGIDISKQLIEKALKGEYSRNSFRGNCHPFRDRYFHPTENGFLIKDNIRSLVNFYYGNIMDANFIWNASCYDFIFCRNLLIYLSKRAQELVFSICDKLLVEEGLLFLGESEYGILRPHQFLLSRFSKVFAFRKKTSTESTKRFKTEFPVQPKPEVTPYKSLKPLFIPEKDYGLIKATENISTDKSLLETAKKLADKGQLEEAKRVCLDYLSQNNLDAQAYFLLGLLYHASGKEKEAEELFNRTLYLEPKHSEALIYLGLLAEKKGDMKKADLYRARVKRVENTSGGKEWSF